MNAHTHTMHALETPMCRVHLQTTRSTHTEFEQKQRGKKIPNPHIQYWIETESVHSEENKKFAHNVNGFDSSPTHRELATDRIQSTRYTAYTGQRPLFIYSVNYVFHSVQLYTIAIYIHLSVFCNCIGRVSVSISTRAPICQHNEPKTTKTKKTKQKQEKIINRNSQFTIAQRSLSKKLQFFVFYFFINCISLAAALHRHSSTEKRFRIISPSSSFYCF